MNVQDPSSKPDNLARFKSIDGGRTAGVDERGLDGLLPDNVPVVQGLLPSLVFIAKYFERPASETVLTAGLPLVSNHLTAELFIASAKRIGLEAKFEQIKFDDLQLVQRPAVVLTKDGACLVLLETLSTGEIEIFDPVSAGRSVVDGKFLREHFSGSVISILPKFARIDVDPGKPELIAKEHWFLGPISQHLGSLSTMALAAVAINVFGIATPLFSMNVYDRVLPNKAFTTLWVLAAGIALVFVFDFVLKVARALLIDTIGKHLDVILSGVIFEKILNTPLVHRSNSSGEFVNRISQYEFLREFFTSSTLTLFIDTVFLFIYLIIVYVIAGWIVLIPLVAMIAVLFIGYVMHLMISEHIMRSETENSLRHAMLVEAVSALETIKGMRAEGQFLRRWNLLVKTASKTQENIKTISSVGLNAAGFLQQSVYIGVIVAGAYRYSNGEMTTGAIIAAGMLASRAVAPLSQIAYTIAKVRYAASALKTLNGVMDLPDERTATTSFVNRVVAAGKIEFKNVSFKYPLDTRLSLAGVNMVIRPGEKVGIIGRVGAGKTTFGRLMAGLYSAVDGEVLIDGVDIRQYHPHEIRRGIGVVMQDTDLFIGSIKANILLSKPDATDEELIAACKLSGVDDFVSLHPLGYDLPVGERGRNLSTGQKQAVALARTFLSSPKILFLDEPSSAMDMATEQMFLKRLMAVARPDQTLVVATHRFSMLSLVERLIVVDNGRVVADGPKEKVLQALKGEVAPATT